ncbi:hypothetical protein QBL02_13750 [Leucobacter sp. UT-8R-CII-1-4]|uniref:hypothetical protein n=1 Tax=Leucobacter sp. UT-8R-CII-1-4 TaxID=3040075 RepID=UPI0024A82787|nr:hypothetical protein [Leucobacter sp. UT-8R-CII-1-4]MDI6024601.1 hypothetical protein [Leucobacter sp. UT-8R-CII-1-4]
MRTPYGRVRPWVALVVLALFVAALSGVAYAALVSFFALEVANTAERELGNGAKMANARLIAARESFNQQMEAFTSEDEALKAEGYQPTNTKGLYWRDGTIEVAGDNAFCEGDSDCTLSAFRTNSFTECLNGVTIDIQTETGEVMSGVTESLPRNGGVDIELAWLGTSDKSWVTRMECR